LDDARKGRNNVQLAATYGVSLVTVKRVKRNEDAIRKRLVAVPHKSDSKVVQRKSGGQILNETMFRWFCLMRHLRVSISGYQLQHKALILAGVLGVPDFKASNGWLHAFQRNYDIHYRRQHGEAGSADAESAVTGRARLLSAMEGYAPCDIYNADEFALFYALPPDASLATKATAGEKKSKHRLSVLIMVNMDGSSKERLMVIGHAERPRCFQGVDMSTLPVTYRNNKTAWMTCVLFKEFVDELNKKCVRLKRRILLIIDNCSAHASVQDVAYSNVKIELLPPNVTSLLQPCDGGIIKTMKAIYRRNLVSKQLAHVEASLSRGEKPQLPVINVRDAIELIHEAHGDLKGMTVANCWRHVGLVPAGLLPIVFPDAGAVVQPIEAQATEVVNTLLPKLRDVTGMPVLQAADFIAIDDHEPATDMATETDIIEEAKERMAAERQPAPEFDDDDEPTVAAPPPTPREALASAEQALVALQALGPGLVDAKTLNGVRGAIRTFRAEATKVMRQSTIRFPVYSAPGN
jgi:hypothetical protein